MTKDISPKTRISQIFAALRERNYTVYTFNSNRPLPASAKGFPDHMIMHKKKALIIFIEVKIGADKMSQEQKDFELCASHVAALCKRQVYYCVVKTVAEAEKLRCRILEGKL